MGRRADAIAALAAVTVITALTLSSATLVEAARCTLAPGRTFAIVRVEQDTTLALAPVPAQPMSFSGVPNGPADSLLATPATPMPAARVRLLELDSATRAILAKNGVADTQPVAFLRAAPYRADCRTIRYTDTIPFVKRGEVGYVRATLAPRAQWVRGVPVLVIPDVWYYPYPRRTGLARIAQVAYGVAPRRLASPQAMFGFNEAVASSGQGLGDFGLYSDAAAREHAIAWARANPADADGEPLRFTIRQIVLTPDWEEASRVRSRLRGTYRVELETESGRSSWFFRTHERPGYSWRDADTNRTIAELLASPHIAGYRILGYGTGNRDSLVTESPRGTSSVAPVWLATTDQPTTPGNDARRALAGMLAFQLSAVSETQWDDLEAFVPKLSLADSTSWARLRLTRSSKQPQLPLTVRLDAGGAVRADTTLSVGKRVVRVSLERVDTLSVRRPW